jgi:hypothetical protein
MAEEKDTVSYAFYSLPTCVKGRGVGNKKWEREREWEWERESACVIGRENERAFFYLCTYDIVGIPAAKISSVPAGRVTRWVCEKNHPKCSQTHFVKFKRNL